MYHAKRPLRFVASKGKIEFFTRPRTTNTMGHGLCQSVSLFLKPLKSSLKILSADENLSIDRTMLMISERVIEIENATGSLRQSGMRD
jgi:hypothetical protein